MSSGKKCNNCGSSDIEVDPARGDAVCTNCGSVLEDNIIVSDVQFEEGAHGNTNIIGQFVSAESKGGATKFGSTFHVSWETGSREITFRKAKAGISNLCDQLRLNQHCIDTSFNFYKMALTRNLTKGRKNTHVYAACVYLTCRTEGTAHLLIDISDVLQICCYELGRTYLQLSQALCINVPTIDPCLYILRFAAKLEFGEKTQEVANTALRLVQRMKRDSIHSGRRPSGLCGAALLIAARLHDFGRNPSDIVKIVKVKEVTLRKRLIEFGDTPSSALTLEEFMTVDLEEEQDPPSFKDARKKDKERLQKVLEEEVDTLSELQREIDDQLEKDKIKRVKTPKDKEKNENVNKIIKECAYGTIKQIIAEDNVTEGNDVGVTELGPDIESLGLVNTLDDIVSENNVNSEEINLTLDDIDDEEIDYYIMNDEEIARKHGLWHQNNAAYLNDLKLKEEKLRKEKEEGKVEKKKRRVRKKTNIGPSNSAGEAIEKILQEKKISSKINYDVLKSLNSNPTATVDNKSENETSQLKRTLTTFDEDNVPSKRAKSTSQKKNKAKEEIGLPVVENSNETIKVETKKDVVSEDDYEDEDDDVHGQDDNAEMGVLQMLQQHRDNENDDEDHYFGGDYDDEEY